MWSAQGQAQGAGHEGGLHRSPGVIQLGSCSLQEDSPSARSAVPSPPPQPCKHHGSRPHSSPQGQSRSSWVLVFWLCVHILCFFVFISKALLSHGVGAS